MSSAGATAQDKSFKSKEQAEEARYMHETVELSRLAAIQQVLDIKKSSDIQLEVQEAQKDFEGGFGGQEHLEDRYATTSGEH